MHIGNTSRLWDMARKRREATQAPTVKVPNTNPIWPEPCIQCGGPAITKYTEMLSGEVSYWCDADYDHWWMAGTYATQLRNGEITSVTDLLVYPDVNGLEDSNWQLEGWPN
jgi:hypothetical protein